MNEIDGTDVAYEDEPKEQRVKSKGKDYQFPGDKMPQDEGNKLRYKSRMKSHNRYKEHR